MVFYFSTLMSCRIKVLIIDQMKLHATWVFFLFSSSFNRAQPILTQYSRHGDGPPDS
jgi:hypothetical protein